MRKIGFDNDQYVRLQSERIRQRINKFGGKLYLEFGGKLFDMRAALVADDRDKLEQMFRLSTQRRAAFDKKLPE